MSPNPTSIAAVCNVFNIETRPFPYQQIWNIPHLWNAQQQGKTRHLTKMRQCGADWFFSLEALIDAVVTGRNQIFLGCSPSSAMIAKNYMQYFLNTSELHKKLSPTQPYPNQIALANGAIIYFIGPQSLSADLHGNVYVSEYAWAKSPKNLITIAESLSMHARYHTTFYTTPSKNPEAWQAYQSVISAKPSIMTFTANDARNSGVSLFDDNWLSEMEKFRTPDEWRMLFMCEWPMEGRQ